MIVHIRSSTTLEQNRGLASNIHPPLTYGIFIPLPEYHGSTDTNHITMEIAYKRPCPCIWFSLTCGILMGGMRLPFESPNVFLTLTRGFASEWLTCSSTA